MVGVGSPLAGQTGSALVDIGLGLWSQPLAALTLLGFQMLPHTLLSVNFEH